MGWEAWGDVIVLVGGILVVLVLAWLRGKIQDWFKESIKDLASSADLNGLGKRVDELKEEHKVTKGVAYESRDSAKELKQSLEHLERHFTDTLKTPLEEMGRDLKKYLELQQTVTQGVAVQSEALSGLIHRVERLEEKIDP